MKQMSERLPVMAFANNILPNYPISHHWKLGSTQSDKEAYLNTVVVITNQVVKLPDLEAKNEKTFQDLQNALKCLTEATVMSQSCLQIVEKQLNNIKDIDETESVVKNLRKLKERLSKFIGYLDKILLFYSDMNNVVDVKPSLENVKESTEKLKSVLKKMNKDKLPDLFSCYSERDCPKVIPEEILCAFVGLQSDVAQRLANLDPDVRSHQTDMYFLLHFISDDCSNAEVDLRNTQAVASKLKEMGFTESRSQLVAGWISKQSLPEHRSLLSWVRIYIENIFNYDIFLNESVDLFPHSSNTINEWFEVQVEIYRPRTSHMVQFFNTTSSAEALNACQKRAQESGLKCWFHGTDHKAANNIVENGIILNNGATNLDFSHGSGFYLNPDCQKTVEWISSTKAGAIIMFKALERTEFKCLNLESNTEHWSRVVKWNRSGEDRDESLDEDFEEEYEECDYIQGPVSIDGAKNTGPNWEPQPSDTQQICVKSKKMASAIGRQTNIIGVVCNKGEFRPQPISIFVYILTLNQSECV